MPDAITHQTADCVSWKQEGHVGEEPGSLAFFGVHGKRILHLQLRKCSWLYYCDVEGMTAPHADDTFKRITDDWVTVADRLHTNAEGVDAWATVARVERIRPRQLFQHTRGAPHLPPKLPMLPELTTFKPTLGPLAEHPFAPDGERTAQTPPGTKRMPHRPPERPMLPELPMFAPALSPLAEQPCAADVNSTPPIDNQISG